VMWVTPFQRGRSIFQRPAWAAASNTSELADRGHLISGIGLNRPFGLVNASDYWGLIEKTLPQAVD
jgi:hypothetical protein